MRITGKQLRQIIKEEVARSVVNEKRAVLQERKPIRVYSDRLRQVVEKVYDAFSDGYVFQLNVASLSLQIEQTLGLERNEELLNTLSQRLHSAITGGASDVTREFNDSLKHIARTLPAMLDRAENTGSLRKCLLKPERYAME